MRSRLARLMAVSPVRRQSLIGLCTTVGSTLIGFASTVYIAHAAGAAALGAYYVLSAYLGFLLLASDPGLGGAAAQRIAERDEPAAHLSAYAVVRVSLALAVVGALLAARPLLVDLDAAGLLPWLALALIASTAAGIIATGVYASGQAGVTQAADLVGVGVRVTVQVAAVALGFGAAGLAGGLVAGTVAAALVNRRFLALRFTRFGKRHLSSLASFALWSFLLSLVAVVSANADTLLLGYLLSDREVALYRTPFQLASLAVLSTMPIRASLAPRIAGWARDGALGEVADALARAWTFALLLAVPAAAGGALLADRLLYFLYGADFAEAAPALVLLLAAELVTVGSLLEGMALSAVGRPRGAFVAAGAGAAVLVIADLALIPVLGVTGAALALLLSSVTATILARLLLARTVTVRFERRPVAAVLVSAALMAVAVSGLRALVPPASLPVAVGTVAFGALVYLFAVLALDPSIRDEVGGLVRALV
ncbi:MAG TPA: oligosaccharide flippase family protein [Methanoregulaceae archaeon]|nr:oligosaccharide flippase family protein [Methanoregulaceae archaeon]